jgi:hypothetical protein
MLLGWRKIGVHRDFASLAMSFMSVFAEIARFDGDKLIIR